MTLFLTVTEPAIGDEQIVTGEHEFWELRPGLHLVETAASRSRLYHDLKALLPDGAPLLVAPLAGEPKFKAMAEGSLTWLREREISG